MNDRNKGLGASDAPVIAGLSPWRTPVELWQEKRGVGTPQREDLPMRAGKALEAVVLEGFSEETGLVVTDRGRRFIDPVWPVRWVTADGMTEDGAVVEAKTDHSAEGWGEPGTDQIPAHYVAQVQHAMACTEAIVAWVPVLIGLRELRVYRVYRDDRIVAQLTDLEQRFWHHVQNGEAPPMLRPSDLRLIYPQDAGTTATATKGVRQTVEALRIQMAHAKAVAKDVDKWKAELQAYMETAATLADEDGKVLCTWKTTRPVGRFDEDALKVEMPEVWAKYRRAGMAQRRFLIKGVKDGDE